MKTIPWSLCNAPASDPSGGVGLALICRVVHPQSSLFLYNGRLPGYWRVNGETNGPPDRVKYSRLTIKAGNLFGAVRCRKLPEKGGGRVKRKKTRERKIMRLTNDGGSAKQYFSTGEKGLEKRKTDLCNKISFSFRIEMYLMFNILKHVSRTEDNYSVHVLLCTFSENFFL